jgi:hypothetical protein
VRGGKWHRGRDNFRRGRGQDNFWLWRWLEIFSGRARGKHELSSAGVFPSRGKPSVVIADVPSPLAEHHRPSRSDSTLARTICIDPVGALPRPTGQRPIFCPCADANGPGQTVYVGGMRRPAGDALSLENLVISNCG